MRDEVAIITGAASGIGRHFAGTMVRRGRRLVLTDIDLPRSRAWLAKLGNLAPGLAVGLTRMLTTKGLRTMARLRRERGAAE